MTERPSSMTYNPFIPVTFWLLIAIIGLLTTISGYGVYVMAIGITVLSLGFLGLYSVLWIWSHQKKSFGNVDDLL